MDDFLTLNDAAEYLGISRMKLWRLVKAEKLTATTNPLDSRERIIRKSELDKLKAQAPRKKERSPLTDKEMAILNASFDDDDGTEYTMEEVFSSLGLEKVTV